MLRLIRNEIKKMCSIKMILGILVVILLSVMLNTVNLASVNTLDNWRDNTQNTILEFEKYKQINQEEGEVHSAEIWESQIQIMQYSLNHNIPYGVNSAWTILGNADSSGFLIFILIVVVCSRIFSVEDSCNTWKNLLVTQCSQRQILFAKINVGCLFAIVCFLIEILLSFFAGGMRYGFQMSTSVVVNYANGQCVEQSLLSEIAVVFLFLILKGCFYACLSMLLTYILKHNVVAIVISIILAGFPSLMGQVMGKVPFYKILPFQYLEYTGIYIFTNDILLKTLLIIVFYTVAMYLIQFFIPKRV